MLCNGIGGQLNQLLIELIFSQCSLQFLRDAAQ